MKVMKKLLLTILISFSLSACSTIEVVHNPVGCLTQPFVSLGLTEAETGTLSTPIKKKIVIFANTLRLIISTQCEKNKLHDKLYETHSK